MYQIRVDYETGDSFGTENTYEIIDIKWKNIDIAKQNLQRIKDHYFWSKRYGEKPDWINDTETNRYYLRLLKDDMTEERICASWCGYFESLHGASIIAEVKDGWSFSL